MKNSKSTKEELLYLINHKLYPSVVELINDLGLEEARFVPKNCYEQCVESDGDIHSNINGEWIRQSSKEKGESYYYQDEADTLMRIAEAYGGKIIELRKEKLKILERLKALKKTGCFNEVYERCLLLEKKS